MLGKCHELASDLLVSNWVISQTTMPAYLKADDMGVFQLKGKQQEVQILSVYLQTDKQAKEKRRLRLFRKKGEKQPGQLNL